MSVPLSSPSFLCRSSKSHITKRTTTSLTASLSAKLSSLISLPPSNKFVEYGLRATFFGLNLVFNLAMWTLFTAALTRSTSTTRVSVVNVSANFFVTAMLGWLIFGEDLPWMWWGGAALLAAGNVIIASRKEGDEQQQQRQQRSSGRSPRLGDDDATKPLLPGQAPVDQEPAPDLDAGDEGLKLDGG